MSRDYMAILKGYFPEAHARRCKHGGFGIYLHADSVDYEAKAGTRPTAAKRAIRDLIAAGSLPCLLGK